MSDVDAQLVASELRTALGLSGLSQQLFALALGTSQPRLSTYLNARVMPSARLLVRARRLGESLGGLHRLGLMSSTEAGSAIRRALADDGDRAALRLLLQARDHLRIVLDEHLALLLGWQARPAALGRPEWEVLLAAVVHHEFSQAGLVAPDWVTDKTLSEAWSYPSALLTAAEVQAQTPPWLASWNVHVPERDLITA